MSRKVYIVNLFVFSIIFIHITMQVSFAYLTVQSIETIGISGVDYVPGEILVRFAPKADGIQKTLEEKNRILSTIGEACTKHSYKLVPGLSLVKLPSGQTVEESLEKLKNKEGILYAHPNYILKTLTSVPNDPCFPYQWGLHNTGQSHPLKPFGSGGFTTGSPDSDIDAPEAWDIHTETEIIVAVIDTGVDYTHPDLAANIWVNEVELNGTADFDDDGNGYIDDVYGWDFADDDNDPLDYLYHGTHCSGIIGAVGNNGEGVTGVCWNIRIMDLKVFPDYGGDGFVSGVIDAIEYASEKGAKVLSNSWGGNYSQPLKNAIEAADEAGVIFVAAAGNNGLDRPDFPAGYDCENIIAVLATDHDDNKWIWSNHSEYTVHLGAPGQDILSTFPTYQTDAMAYGGFSTDYEVISGTSMSTPFVAGACALVWSMNPQLTHHQIKQIILDTTDVCCGLKEMCITEGRLNLYKAMLEASKNKQALELTADVTDCVLPFNAFVQNYLVYDIYWDANGFADTNSKLIDYLPEYLTYYSSDPVGDYNSANNTVTWDLGTLTGAESDYVQITTKLNTNLCPCSKAENTVVLKGDNCYNTQTEEVTVCNWGPDVIYVDADANEPGNNGTSWDNAYLDIQDALEAVKNCPDSFKEIWVAAGTYKPANDADCFDAYKEKSFELIEGVDIFGHFAGDETSPGQRIFTNPDNTTTLDGLIETNEKVNNIVTAQSVNGSILDGFTIQGAGIAGIHLEAGSVNIKNCTIRDTYAYGINIVL